MKINYYLKLIDKINSQFVVKIQRLRKDKNILVILVMVQEKI